MYLENGSPLQYPRRLYKYVKYGYSAASPETLKAPPEQETLLHSLVRIGLKVLTNEVCACADDEIWKGFRRGENPGGNFRLKEVSGEPGWLFTDPFQNIFLFFLLNFVPFFQLCEIIRNYPTALPTEL